MTDICNEKFPIVIAGSRGFTNIRLMLHELKSYCQERNLLPSDIEIVSGTAKGADQMGEFIAKRLNIQLKQFEPNWKTYGNYAGMLRNDDMAKYANSKSGGCIVFWDGESRGSKNMIELAKKYELDYVVVNYGSLD